MPFPDEAIHFDSSIASSGKDTVMIKTLETIVILWYDLRVFWPRIKCIKNAAKLFFTFYANKNWSKFSKKLVFDLASLRVSKL